MSKRKAKKEEVQETGRSSSGGSAERPQGRASELDGAVGFLDGSDRGQEIEFPLGLDNTLDNLHREKKKFRDIYLGVVDEQDVKAKYKDMKLKVTNKFLTMLKVNENGNILEMMRVPTQSRYNPEYDYSRKVVKKLASEMNNLKKATHIVCIFRTIANTIPFDREQCSDSSRTAFCLIANRMNEDSSRGSKKY